MLASRLGVALLIILGITGYVSNRPGAAVHMVTTSTDEQDSETPTIRVGGLTIDPEKDSLSDIVAKVEQLDKDGVFIEHAHEGLKTALEEQEIERQRAEALKAASEEIAKEFSLISPPAEELESSADRLSEEEVQALVVERLLSVQAQSSAETDDASAPSPQATVTDQPNDQGSDAQEVAPPVLASPASPEPALQATAPKELERIRKDFSGQTLMGTDFRNKDLSGVDFSNAKLTAAKFDGSNLTGTNFSGAKIQGASFSGAWMQEAKLHNAQAQTARFTGSNLSGADLTQANFAGADLTNADLRGAKMDDLNINGAIMSGTRLGDLPEE